MSALEHIRQMIDRAESPEPDIAEALDAARRLLNPTLAHDDRELWNVILENSIGIAVSRGHLYGPRFVRSAVDVQGKARAESARKFADSMAVAALERAGFTKEEIEDGERELIQSWIDSAMEAHLKKLRAGVYEALGLPVPEDEE